MPHYDSENGANYKVWRREHQSEIERSPPDSVRNQVRKLQQGRR